MRAYRIRISLAGTDPLIWREITVPEGIRFSQLHKIFQKAMGWEDRHDYFFSLNEGYTRITGIREEYEEYSLVKRLTENNELNRDNDPNAMQTALLQKEMKYAGTTRVGRYLEETGRFVYVYDLGDHWIHDIEIIDIIEDYKFGYPKLHRGSEHCPPENIGGAIKYGHLLKARESNDPECLNLAWDLLEDKGTPYDPKAVNKEFRENMRFSEKTRIRAKAQERIAV
ncbi:MAG TPA: plasmid pRiA4b ORF-3 family protein [Clostridiaceae bacterium]|nr:plasmid pRiA4b ORF-3 family protein [Clostridiaceae bacterium]